MIDFDKLGMFVLTAGVAAGLGCATTPDDGGVDDGEDGLLDPTDDELADQIANGPASRGKADGADSVIISLPGRILLGDAPARQLYVLMDADHAPATTIGGFRILRGRRTACITDGLDTVCELRGTTDSDPEAGFAAGLHGNSTTSASSYLMRLLRVKTGETGPAVSVPWFQCVKQGGVWCGVEEPRALALAFSKLPPVGDSFVYEGWIVLDGATTTGRFQATSALTQVIPASLAAATAYVLTVEPRRNDPAAASGTHILAGSLESGAAALTTEHAAAIGTDFATAAARYVLATPSTAATDDNNLGVWFVDPSGQEALVLPVLPAGWIYEGWVVNDEGPAVTTGRFRSGMGADSDGAGPTAGPLPGPPRPGQDFIMPPRDLVDGKVAITVEPEPDTSAAPFPIRPLLDTNVTAVPLPGTQALANTHEERPSGTVSRQ